MGQDRWGNASTRGQRMVLDETVEKMSEGKRAALHMGGGLVIGGGLGEAIGDRVGRKKYQRGEKPRRAIGAFPGHEEDWWNTSSIERGYYRAKRKDKKDSVEKFSMAPLKTMGRQMRGNFNRGMKGQGPSMPGRNTTNLGNTLNQAANYTARKRKPLAIGAAVGGGGMYMAKADVSKKERNYDEEHSRQRRLGGAAALSGVGGALLMVRGGRRVSANGRKAANLMPGTHSVSQKVGSKGKPGEVVMERLPAGRRNDYPNGRWAAVDAKSATQLGLGAGLVATSGGINRYAHSNRNRKWD